MFMIACSMRKLLTQVCVSFQREQTIVILILSVLFKKLATFVQVTNKYSNLQQTNQISVFAATTN